MNHNINSRAQHPNRNADSYRVSRYNHKRLSGCFHRNLNAFPIRRPSRDIRPLVALVATVVVLVVAVLP